ncbi:MAG: gamma-glutamyltransferase family protein [Gemmatimonadaceae bacterium]
MSAPCGPVRARRAMVASSQSLASAAGVEVLRDGGTAADACVAMDAVLHVTEPTSTGLGGDMFALYYDARVARISALNGSGGAPHALTLERLLEDGFREIPPTHGLAVTVPGVCAGWFDLVARHGTMPMSHLLRAAIRLAEDGFPVGAVTAAMWERNVAQLRSLELTVNGRAPRRGETFRNAGLARVLRALAEGGPDAFYRGDVARAIVAAVQGAGGWMTLDDLAAHRSTWEEPIGTTYRGVGVWECPPNGQGLTALLALNILDGLAPGAPESAERWHGQIEALRLAFADARWYVADPRHTPVPVDALLSKRYAAGCRARIDSRRATADVVRGSPAVPAGTVYHCAVDERGDACSFVSSHFMGFGTGIVPAGAGFVLQNRGRAFVLDAAHPNAPAPGKRPYHTIIPAMLTRADGTLWGPMGVMGGYMQPQGHVQVVTSLVDDGADPQLALDRPRFCLEPEDARGLVQLERGVAADVVEGLRARGHAVVADVPSFGRALFGRGQIILRHATGELAGGSDHRGDGCAIGYS